MYSSPCRHTHIFPALACAGVCVPVLACTSVIACIAPLDPLRISLSRTHLLLEIMLDWPCTLPSFAIITPQRGHQSSLTRIRRRTVAA